MSETKSYELTFEDWKDLLLKYKTIYMIAKHLKVDRSTVRKWLKRYELIPLGPLVPGKEARELQEIINPVYDNYFKLTGDACICSDNHIPSCDIKAHEYMIKKAIQYLKPPRKIIIAGDFISFDALSFFARNTLLQEVKVADELKLADYILTIIEEAFEEIYIIPGNHMERFFKITRGAFDTDVLLSLMNRFNNKKYHITSYGYCYLDNIRVTHPNSYRQQKLSVANDLSLKHECPIVNAHGHFFSIGKSKNGKHTIIDSGGLFDQERVKYTQMHDTTYPNWNQGFIIYKNKKFIPFSPDINEWYY